MKNTIIISAFPGCGKSYFFKNSDYIALDSDSNQFSWVKNQYGNNTKTRNPDFPSNYINHIKENIGKVDIIFISSHKEVRDALYANKIQYYIVKPDKSLKENFLKRYKERGNDSGFIKTLTENWDNWLDDLSMNMNNFIRGVFLLTNNKPYIASVIDDIFALDYYYRAN